ncbi:hypothetical protein CHGG_04216 [Chaetomium globosum CBS 148.51]|uniref:Uncharacterized protein n=1 Tax=Chaetomium globosum (strain ATCC 6205 / CBS 148.51 / DSM 1962 / NBRC 6347 / NRRL 1970) TaxID=306901 RepID=Q2H1Y0_CHAGB|nr:uncharacterized protein CHGG_04216 [Chaetomium globosum CBS 148.51]EAQ87597.1 hypothetical protein CHGG_04216 [Chaetomium globosum CBS 148.51]
MQTKLIAFVAFAAVGQARFGQEGSVQNIIQSLSNFGPPGAAGTLAGQTPGVLLAGASACAQLELADEIVATLGNDPEVIAGAAALVAAEKNFNPFAQDVPAICSNPNLPATPELRGIVPAVDPAVDGADIQNANSAQSLATPFDDGGLSVADLSRAQGFENFNAQA